MKMNNSANLVKKFIGIYLDDDITTGIIIRGDGILFCEKTTTIEDGLRNEKVCGKIVDLINKMISSIGGYKTDIKGIGIVYRDTVNSKTSVIEFDGKLDIQSLSFANSVADKIGLPVKIAGESELGEMKFPLDKNTDSSPVSSCDKNVFRAAALWL